MTSSWIYRVGFGIGVLALALSSMASACKGKDCADERIGQKRCVGNRLEICAPGNVLEYDSCTVHKGDDKYCSPILKACVTKEIFDAQTASSASTGVGGMGAGGMGAGGEMTASTTMASSTTAASSSSDASATASSSSASTGGGGLMSPMNGCDPNAMSGAAAVTDYTGNPSPLVIFTNNAFTYQPACLKIKAGQTVLFFGNGSDFTMHPLVGGTIDGANNKLPDATSPIPKTSTGQNVSVTFPQSGVYGFYCDFHYAVGMKGAVYVVP